MIMSERDSVHKEIEKLQEEVWFFYSCRFDFNKDFNFIKTNDTSNKALI